MTLVGERTDILSLTQIEGPSNLYETYIPILVVCVPSPSPTALPCAVRSCVLGEVGW